MKKKKKKSSRSIVGAVIAVILTILLLNPAWLPLPAATKENLAELEKTHFLIERSGRITLPLIALITVISTARRSAAKPFFREVSIVRPSFRRRAKPSE